MSLGDSYAFVIRRVDFVSPSPVTCYIFQTLNEWGGILDLASRYSNDDPKIEKVKQNM